MVLPGIRRMQGILYEPAKAIFLVVPKTASTSIRRVLFPDRPDKAHWQYEVNCGRARWPGWFRFAFVRNSWDRLVSCWAEKIQQRLPTDTIWRGFRKYGWPANIGFPEFIRAVCAMGPEIHNHHFSSQVDLLTFKGEWCVDALGRYERLDEDWAFMANRLDMPGRELGRHLTSTHKPYREYYTRELWNMVAKTFARDIEVLGYTEDWNG